MNHRPAQISLLSAPITAADRRNAKNRPVTELGPCTPFQLLTRAQIRQRGMVCLLGDPGRSLGLAAALARRAQRPFLLLGAAGDARSSLGALAPKWTLEEAAPELPPDNGAIFFRHPFSAYLEICQCLEQWQDRLVILHPGTGLQVGPVLLDQLCALEQCVVLCDALPQSLRSDEGRALTPGEFLSRAACLGVFSAGAATNQVVELLPRYQYEKVSNTLQYNAYRGQFPFRPLSCHRNRGFSLGQTRTMEFKKSLFESDELDRLSAEGTLLVYNSGLHRVFLAEMLPFEGFRGREETGL